MENVINSESPVLTPKNWEYPKLSDHVFTFQDKSHEDLPDAMRWADAIDKEIAYCGLKGKELATFLEEWKHYTASDDVRVPYAYKSGGKMPENWNAVKKLRVVGKAFIYKVGKHLLSGNFNLTTIPFPIRAMIPKSYLEYVGCTPTAFFPLYMNLALKTSDPVERFKLYIVASICYYFKTTSFAKPLNPIIGETCTGQYDDGSHFYLEQVSHHPPISYMLLIGPNDAYRYYGPSQYAASAGLNSLTVTAKAWRKVTFKDNGQTIHNTIPNEYYDGSLLGQTVHSTIGSMEFTDEANKISCIIELGKVKKKPSDYIEAVITVNGKPVSKLTGTYLGWLDFDGKRYFDWRYTQPFQPELIKSPLHSDFHYRADRALLAKGQYDAAQTEKERLEQIQRTDAKLRKEAKGEATGPANGQTL